MKLVAGRAFYVVGALAVRSLAPHAYAVISGGLVPGDPIHIFRKPDAASYS